MKISYSHPITGNCTSVTLNDGVIRLWAIASGNAGFDERGFVVDDFSCLHSSGEFSMILKDFIFDCHFSYLDDSDFSKFPTFVSFFENQVFTMLEFHMVLSRLNSELND